MSSDDGKIVDLHGKPVGSVSDEHLVKCQEAREMLMRDQSKRHAVLANKAMADLKARVYNLESALIMLATTVKKGVTDPEHQHELDTYMEAYYTASVARGATHLATAAADEDGDVFM